jgi:hypothetical protein
MVGSIYGRSSVKNAHFEGEDFKKLAHQKQELPVAALFVNRSEQNVQSLDGHHRQFFFLIGRFF